MNSGQTLTLDGTTAVNGSGSVADNGTITVTSGSADIGVAVTGSGALDIDAAATLELGGTSANTVTFEGGTGTLVLDNPASFTGEIVSFTGTAANASSSDEIVLSNFNPASLHDTVSDQFEYQHYHPDHFGFIESVSDGHAEFRRRLHK